jgi:16S rRNA (guanine1516-N2)-methyltransferase
MVGLRWRGLDALWFIGIVVLGLLSSDDSHLAPGLPSVNAFNQGGVTRTFPSAEGNCNRGRVCCCIDDRGVFVDELFKIARSLNLPILSQDDNDADFYLDGAAFSHALKLVPFESNLISTYALAIEALPSFFSHNDTSKRKRPKRKQSATPPFYVDLCASKKSRIGKRGSQQQGTDLLLRAAGLKKRDDAVVFDLTAGFGQDSVLLALSGGVRRVVMVERDPIVASLLDDALRRVNLLAEVESDYDEVELAKSISKCLTLVVGDSSELSDMKIELMNETPSVVYLDPMFPPRTKSAAVKKNMQILHGLLDTQILEDTHVVERECEESRLLNAALLLATGRVVVKRPINANPLGGDVASLPSPSYAVKGSTSRWDVYIK